MKKSTSLLLLILVVVLTIGWTITGLVEIPLGKYDHIPFTDSRAISKGLDLNGGVYAVYQAVDETLETLADDMKGTIEVMRNRLDSAGYTEATITQQGTAQIRVEIPNVSDPEQVLSIIGQPAKLEFLDPDGNVVIDGSHVVNAEPGTYQGAYVVNFKLNDEGTKLFSSATAKLAASKSAIRIMLDGVEISAPTVNTQIPSGEGYIEGSFADYAAAEKLALQIQSGALPLDIKQIEVRTISATLGVDALKSGVLAGVIGVAAVLVFMLLYYRMPGLVADLCLVLYIMIVLTTISAFGVQLTLPGIAGIILGMGMAVDANVVIYERIKEEIRSGKTVRSAVETGYAKAGVAIFDANITTIIAGVVLMVLGTGSIKGFAYTLLIGIIASMITALLVSRGVFKLIVNLDINNTWLYGVSRKSIKKEEA
ncbi:MAG: protein translocase subunit SecD [Eubacteriales bacterium]|nr:protein translocase subunit SecD [Eubacteriales bacterium]